MAKACSICTHVKRAAIDLALLNGGSVRITAAEFGFDDFSAIARHKRNHLPGVLAAKVLQTEAHVRAEMRPNMEQVLDTLWELYRKLGACCRPHVFEVIEAMEARTDEPDHRMEIAD